MPVPSSPRTKPRPVLGDRVGLARDLAIVAVCVALVAGFLSNLWSARAPGSPPAAAQAAKVSRAP